MNLGSVEGDYTDKQGNTDVVWSKIDAEQKTVDGITYNAYTVAGGDQWVYIQDSITEII